MSISSASPSHSAPDGPVCSCGHPNAPGASQCERPRCRRVLPGNALSRRTELWAANHSPEVEAIEAAGEALFEQSLIDAGGRSELTARAVATHRNRALAQVTIEKLALALRRHGMFDKRGRLRSAWIQRLESLIATSAALDRTLGLDRRAKRFVDVRDEIAHAIRSQRAEQEAGR